MATIKAKTMEELAKKLVDYWDAYFNSFTPEQREHMRKLANMKPDDADV